MQGLLKTRLRHVWLAVAVLSCGAVQAQMPTACFGETQWQALQESSNAAGQPALLYVWSPRMVLSAVHAHEVAQVARQQGLRFVPVHDGRLPPEEVQQALNALPARLQRAGVVAEGPSLGQSQPLCAPTLVQQEAYRHFPTAWVVRQGGYHPQPLVAAMPSAYWREGIRLRLQPSAKAGKN